MLAGKKREATPPPRRRKKRPRKEWAFLRGEARPEKALARPAKRCGLVRSAILRRASVVYRCDDACFRKVPIVLANRMLLRWPASGNSNSGVVCLSAMHDRSTWQFRLSDLFALTTLAAIAAAVAAACGPGTLLLSAGVMLAFINWRGAFTPLQSGQLQAILLGLAWCSFLISLALPSVQVFGPTPGWVAAWVSITAPLTAIWKCDFAEPNVLGYFGIGLANVLMALLPVLLWRLRRGHGQWFSAALCIAMVFPWSVGWNTPMLVGYYVWCSAFYLALCALPLRCQSLATMVLLAGFLGVAAEKGYLWR